jgi:hypothetical protein
MLQLQNILFPLVYQFLLTFVEKDSANAQYIGLKRVYDPEVKLVVPISQEAHKACKACRST